MSKLTWTFLLVGSMAGIAAFYLITKLLDGAVPPLLLAFFRFTVASIALLPVMVYRNSLRLPKTKDLPLLIFISVCIVIPTIFVVSGIEHTNSIIAAIMINTNPLIIAILSPLLIGENVTFRKKIAIGIGFIGVAAVILNGQNPLVFLDSNYVWGTLLLLLAALFSGLNKMYSKDLVRLYDGLSVTFFSTVIGSGVLAIALSFTDGYSHMLELNRFEVFALIAIGVLSTAIPWTIWSSSLKHLDVHVAASFMLLVPIFATLYSFIFLSESFTLWMLLGMILTSVGIYVVQREAKVVPSV